MSEFSESYHLEAGDQQAGIHLLRRAHLEGFVFPPQRGWVSIIPRSSFGQLPDALVQANQGVLLRYLLDEDAGWMLEVFTDPQLASHYQCRWLDWSDQEGRITVDARRPGRRGRPGACQAARPRRPARPPAGAHPAALHRAADRPGVGRAVRWLRDWE